jgi:hypothetical protein
MEPTTSVAHVSGVAPNRWGVLRDGTDLRESVLGIFPLSPEDEAASRLYQDARYGTFKGDALRAAAAAAAEKGGRLDIESCGTLSKLSDGARRAQPLWPAAALALAQEVLNRRLFSQVGPSHRLTG